MCTTMSKRVMRKKKTRITDCGGQVLTFCRLLIAESKMLLRNRKRRGYLVENVMMDRSRAGCEQYDIPIKMLQSGRMFLVKTLLRRMRMRTGG